MLKVNEIEVSYGEIQALWGPSFEASQGTIVGLLGPNGAGKTTTFMTIAGLLTPKSGLIEFEGQNITTLLPAQRVELGISLVPEGRKLFPFMSVEDNLLLGSYVKRAKLNRQKSLDRVLELFPILQERLSQQAGTLSGGQQQMLAIGRGLMSDPKLLILDEPSLGLAPIIVDDIFDVFKKINEEGVTVLISEQHINRVLKIIDFGHVIEQGKIAVSGTATELENNTYVKEAYLGL